jgi:hypothetical protein
MKKIVLISVLSFLFSFNLFAATPPPPPTTTGGTTKPACWPPPCIPVDGGIVFLAIAGAAYGSRKLFQNLKK